MPKHVIAVDFDGTLAEERPYPEMGPPCPGAREFMQGLVDKGYTTIIYSCRTSAACHTEEEMVANKAEFAEWFAKHNIPYHEIWVGPGKPKAKAYVDDRAVSCTGGVYPELLDEVVFLVDEY